MTQKKWSQFDQPTSVAEADNPVGLASGKSVRWSIATLRNRINIGIQNIIGKINHTGDYEITGDIDHTGDQDTSGNVKAGSFEGDGTLITGAPGTGVGGTESNTSLTLKCNADNSTPAAQIVGSKFTQNIFAADENGFAPKTGIPFSHEDDAIPFNKDTDYENNHLLKSQTILDQQSDPYYHFDNVDDYLSHSSITIPLTIGAFIIVRFKTSTSGNAPLLGNSGESTHKYLEVQSDKIKGETDTDVENFISTSFTPDGEWHILAISADAGNITSYLDGELADTQTVTDDVTFNQIGRRATTVFMDGDIADIKIGNRALTATELKSFSSNPQRALVSKDNGAAQTAQNVSNCVNGDYTTFANGTPTGFDATSNGVGTDEASTADEISYIKGRKYRITFDLVLNSGTAPQYILRQSTSSGNISEEGSTLAVSGSNSADMTATETTTGVVAFLNSSTTTDFEITNLKVRQIGCFLEYNGKNISEDRWFDSQGTNHATNNGASQTNNQEYGNLMVNELFGVPSLTTTQKNALTAFNRLVVYDSTLNKFQGFENGSWTSFI